MRPYIAVGIDATTGKKCYADGDTPRDARLALQRQHMHLTRILTFHVPVEERRKYKKLMEAQ